MKKFIALAKADITNKVSIKDEIVDCVLDPVYEKGYYFTGEVCIYGFIDDQGFDEETLTSVLNDYLLDEDSEAEVLFFQVRQSKVKIPNTYRKAG